MLGPPNPPHPQQSISTAKKRVSVGIYYGTYSITPYRPLVPYVRVALALTPPRLRQPDDRSVKVITNQDKSKLGLESRLVRRLRLGRDPGQMAALPARPVDEGGVLCHPVIPHHNGTGLPLDTSMEVGPKGDVVFARVEVSGLNEVGRD